MRNSVTITMRIMAALCLGAVLFCFYSNPLNRIYTIDSSVFAYIGRRMTEGAIPYRDIFDHKGPLLYILNCLGMWLKKIGGVWILESLGIVSSFAYLFCRLEKDFDEIIAHVTSLSCLVYFIYFFAGGNLTETYAFYLLIPCVCIMFEASATGFVSLLRMAYSGGALGGIVLLRPNMVAFAVPLGLWLIYDAVKHRDITTFLIRCGVAALGFVVVVLPILGWLWVNGALVQMFNDYIRFNLKYMASSKVIFDRALDLPISAGFVCLNIALMFIRSKWRIALGFNLIFQIVSLALILPNMRYFHYYVPFVPTCVLPVAVLIQCIVNRRGCLRLLVCAQFLLAAFVAFVCLTSVFDARQLKKQHSLALRKENIWPGCERLLALVDDKASVQVLRNDCVIYLTYGLTSPWRYAYLTPIALDDVARNEVLFEISACSAKYVLYNENYGYSWLLPIIAAHYKQIAMAENGLILYMATNGTPATSYEK